MERYGGEDKAKFHAANAIRLVGDGAHTGWLRERVGMTAEKNTKREIIRILAALAIGKLVVLLAVFLVDRSTGFLQVMNTRWDSLIFESIATQGYTQSSYYAFSPLYPALIKGLGLVVPHAWVSGLIITNVVSFVFPLILYRTFGYRTALMAAVFPTYLVFTTISYSDVITLVFLALSIMFMLQERVIASSAAVSLAIFDSFHLTWTLPAYAYAVLRKKRVGLWRSPLSLSWQGYSYYFGSKSGQATTCRISRSKAVSGESISLRRLGQMKWILNGWLTSQPWEIFGFSLPPTYWLARNLLFEVFYLVGAFLILKTSDKHKVFLFVYTLVAIIPLLLMTGTPAISIPRLLLPAFPVFYAYATVMKREKYYLVYLVLCLVLAAWVSVSQTYSFFA